MIDFNVIASSLGVEIGQTAFMEKHKSMQELLHMGENHALTTVIILHQVCATHVLKVFQERKPGMDSLLKKIADRFQPFIFVETSCYAKETDFFIFFLNPKWNYYGKVLLKHVEVMTFKWHKNRHWQSIGAAEKCQNHPN